MTRKVKAETGEWTPRPAARSSVLDAITRFWVTLLIIVAIVYGALLAISRTDGFRGIVRQRVESLAGVPVEIAATRLTPSLDLILEGVRETRTDGRVPAIEIGRAVIDARWIPLMRGNGWPFQSLRGNDCVIRFSRSASGAWAPLPGLQRALAPWIGLEQDADAPPPMNLTDYLRGVRARIVLDRVRVVWMQEEDDAAPLAAADGLHFRCEPVRPMDQDILWCRLSMERSESLGLPWINGLDMEWIRLPDQDVILRIVKEEPETGRDASPPVRMVE